MQSNTTEGALAGLRTSESVNSNDCRCREFSCHRDSLSARVPVLPLAHMADDATSLSPSFDVGLLLSY
jgi:hypothetical protein